MAQRQIGQEALRFNARALRQTSLDELHALQMGGKHLNNNERNALEEINNSRKHLLDVLPSGLFRVLRPWAAQDGTFHAGQGFSNEGLPTVDRSAELVATQYGLEWFAELHEAIQKHYQ